MIDYHGLYIVVPALVLGLVLGNVLRRWLARRGVYERILRPPAIPPTPQQIRQSHRRLFAFLAAMGMTLLVAASVLFSRGELLTLLAVLGVIFAGSLAAFFFLLRARRRP